jgi:hypothetical protein
MKDLLRLASEALGLRRPAVQRTDTHGRVITSLNEIELGDQLFVACVAPSPREWTDPGYKSRRPLDPSNRTLKLMKPPKRNPRPPDMPQHEVISSSRATLKDNLRDSMLSVFSTLTTAQKARLPF